MTHGTDTGGERLKTYATDIRKILVENSMKDNYCLSCCQREQDHVGPEQKCLFEHTTFRPSW